MEINYVLSNDVKINQIGAMSRSMKILCMNEVCIVIFRSPGVRNEETSSSLWQPQ